MGIALQSLNARLSGALELEKLNEAIKAYQLALTVSSRNQYQDWAMTQTDLGIALAELGERLGGAEAARNLSRAVEAYRLALTVYTRDQVPPNSAEDQNNLGTALGRWANFWAARRAVRRLNEAIEACPGGRSPSGPAINWLKNGPPSRSTSAPRFSATWAAGRMTGGWGN